LRSRHDACRRGYWVRQGYAKIDDDCHAGSAFAKHGQCTAIRKASSIGADPGLEWAAISDEEAIARLCDARCVRALRGNQDHATLACNITSTKKGDTTLAVSIQQREVAYASDGFAQLHYDGTSPMQGEEIECVVVLDEVARDRSNRELAAIDSEVARASSEPIGLANPHPVAVGIDAARVHADVPRRCPRLKLRAVDYV